MAGSEDISRDAEVIIGALQLARERVTGDDLAAKARKRQELVSALEQVRAWQGGGGDKPDAARLRELLGDPDDRVIRVSLAALEGA